jgi:hypothetical protein
MDMFIHSLYCAGIELATARNRHSDHCVKSIIMFFGSFQKQFASDHSVTLFIRIRIYMYCIQKLGLQNASDSLTDDGR